MSPANQVAPAAYVISFEVADWARWKAAFDAHKEARKEAGILGHHVNRGLENPNRISLYAAVGDVAKTRAFLGSDKLKSVMADAGVIGRPEILWMKPVSENVVWDRELPAMMVSHSVADFAKWFEAYQAKDALRSAAGVIGHAVNQAENDPNQVVVYHQAEKHSDLQSFMANPDLKDAMQKAGVTSAPQVTYVTGGWGEKY